tara:strand:- start:171 stop:506 length:336 start_codon:yes stop_codon:yes gene_type:complete
MIDLKNESNIILHENVAGFVIKCKNCGEITVSFGNIISHMTEKEFINLFHGMNKIMNDLHQFTVMISESEKVIVRSPIENLIFSFEINDFHQIIELLDQAKLSLDIRKIMN